MIAFAVSFDWIRFSPVNIELQQYSHISRASYFYCDKFIRSFGLDFYGIWQWTFKIIYLLEYL